MAAVLLDRCADMYREERLRPLKTYRYQGVDRSFVSRYVLAPYWNWVVTLFPLWMAPNLITLIGLLFMFAALAATLVYIPDLVGPGPSWVYFFCALCLWIYSTLDNIDGKQARRTGSSSPLGELFDHGCDALNCSIGAVVLIAVTGLGTTVYSFLVIDIVFWAFYLPTWEEFHTGVLNLGYINGPTEGILAGVLFMALSGVFGPKVWMTTLADHLPPTLLPPPPISTVPICHALLAFFYTFFFAVYVPSYLVSVRAICRQRGTSFVEALTQILPMALTTTSSYLWLWSPYSSLRHHPSYFALFALTVGVAFGKMSTKIIYAHLTKQPFPYYTGLMLPLVLGSLLVNVPAVLPAPAGPVLTPAAEHAVLWLWLGVALVGYANWSYHVIASFCRYLDIYCFQIKHKKCE